MQITLDDQTKKMHSIEQMVREYPVTAEGQAAINQVQPRTKVEKQNKKELPAVGSTISFGRYPQGANGEVQPIEWIVLDRAEKRNEILIFSYTALDIMPYCYNQNSLNVCWENSDLREWLNNIFLKTAFSEAEARRIVPTGFYSNTKDWIFLLNQPFYNKNHYLYLKHPLKKSAYVSKKAIKTRYFMDAWWLRPQNLGSLEYVREQEDSVRRTSDPTFDWNLMVRPAMYLKM
jgi:hypothetical protein